MTVLVIKLESASMKQTRVMNQLDLVNRRKGSEVGVGGGPFKTDGRMGTE